MSGLTAAGFTPALLREILSDIETAEKAAIHPAVDVASARPLGQLNGVFSEREETLWDLLRTAYGAFDPDVAEGYLLDALSALTGTVRRPAAPSLVTCTVDLDAAVTLPEGSTAYVLDQPTRLFRSTAEVTSTTAGAYDVLFESVDTGAVPANAGTLTVIAGPVAGWNSITNAEDAALGRDLDTDAILRQRRREALQRNGGGTPDAIRSDLLQIDGITKVVVFENLTETTDGDGLPPFSLEILVFDGVIPSVDDDVIAQAIWDTRAGGALTYGTSSGTAVDSEGDAHTIFFTRPTVKEVWIAATVDTEGVTPEDAILLLRDHLVSTANLILETGTDVIALEMKSVLFESKNDKGYTWVHDVPTLTLGFAPSPVGTSNLAISNREIAQLDTSRVTITLS